MKNKKLLVLLVLPIMFSCKAKAKTTSSVSESTSAAVASVSSVEAVSENEDAVSENGNENITSAGNASSNGVSSGTSIRSDDTYTQMYTSTIRPNITQSGLEIKDAAGSLESAYVEWVNVENANKYVVRYKASGATAYTEASDYLIRNYGNYSRVDIPGLKAGEYEINITAINDDGTESEAKSSVTLTTMSHIREGFGFLGGSASGAYNDDGTLQDNCDVIYVTAKNAKTVTCTVDGVTYTGIQAILSSKEKTGSTKPMCIRFIGRINKADLDSCGSSEEGLQIKGKTIGQNMNLTIEGIGSDSYCYGFGILIRKSMNVEIRNLGFIEAMDDCVSIDTDNSHLWVHNNDFFYGHNQGGDKSKGDGSLDTKGSTLITHSFNHFWDSGKCNLQGMKSESKENSITYHHNWFDHSDSRHPRVRTAQVHVYNNYYDGNAKYGVGSTMGSSVFVEANYFRNCLNPMLISMQGSDIAYDPDGKGTFSSEEGGIIKSYNNHIEGGRTPVTYTVNNTEFDCYAASSRYEEVPSTVTSKSGGNTYNNFDTSSSMYTYTAETPEAAMETVKAYAGRINGGDFKYTFADTEDTNYSLIPELVTALLNYQSSIVSVQGDVTGADSTSGGGSTSSETTSGSVTSGETTSGGTSQATAVTPVEGGIVHNFTSDGLTSSYFTISGNLSTSKGTVTYNDLTLTQCLKIETATSISFTTTEKMTLTLVFNSTFTGTIKVDGTKVTATSGIVTVELDAGTHTITKGDSANLYYMSLN